MKLEPIIRLPSARTGVDGRFGVHLFEGQITVSDMDRLDAIGVEWRRRNPGKSVELVVIFPSEARMTAEERDRMTRLIRRWEHERIASATVILATGLLGAMQRSVLTGFQLVAPPPHPVKVFGAVAEAVTWLLPHIRSLSRARVEAADVVDAVTDFCAAFQKK